MKLTINNFAGSAPKIASHLIPDNFGQEANEVKLDSGDLSAFYADQDIVEVPKDTVKYYKYYIPGASEPLDHVWLYFNKDVSVVKGPVFSDANNRIIISGIDSHLRVTDYTKFTLTKDSTGMYKPITLTTSNTYILGIPRISGITMSIQNPVTNKENIESRAYTVALVREWGDGKLDIGGLSSPASRVVSQVTYNTIDVATGETVKLSNINIPASYYKDYGIRKAYVYRSTVGSDGTATYGYVGEFPVTESTTSYTFSDSRSSEDVEESAVSLEWDAPVDNLQGLVSLNNGVLAAFTGSDVYFSYPYQTHAWPYTYRVSVDYNVVGLGAFGNTVVICTEGAPTLALVSDPASVTLRAINESFPCLSKDSIVNFASGVVYASSGGLLWINSTSPKYITSQVINKDSWRWYNSNEFVSAGYEGKYVGVSRNPVKRFGIIFNIEDPSKGVVSFYRSIDRVWSDPESNALYLLINKDNKKIITLFDSPASSSNQAYTTYNWRSKLFFSNNGIATMAAARVRTNSASIKTVVVKVYTFKSHTINSVPFNTLDINGPVDLNQVYKNLTSKSDIYFIYYVDGIPRYTKVVQDSKPFKLPSGFRGDTFEIEVEATSTVSSIELASSMGELL